MFCLCNKNEVFNTNASWWNCSEIFGHNVCWNVLRTARESKILSLRHRAEWISIPRRLCSLSKCHMTWDPFPLRRCTKPIRQQAFFIGTGRQTKITTNIETAMLSWSGGVLWLSDSIPSFLLEPGSNCLFNLLHSYEYSQPHNNIETVIVTFASSSQRKVKKCEVSGRADFAIAPYEELIQAFFPPSFPLSWPPIPPADRLSLRLSQLLPGSAEVLAALWHIW